MPRFDGVEVTERGARLLLNGEVVATLPRREVEKVGFTLPRGRGRGRRDLRGGTIPSRQEVVDARYQSDNSIA